MSTTTTTGQRANASTSSTNPPPERSYFETQRAALVGEIAVSFEHVLANINKLNRSLEEVIVLGNEFSSVEALWSQFENVMAKDPDAEEGSSQQQQQQQQQQYEEGRGERDDDGGSEDS